LPSVPAISPPGGAVEKVMNGVYDGMTKERKGRKWNENAETGKEQGKLKKR
jgi:hypothetical protein